MRAVSLAFGLSFLVGCAPASKTTNSGTTIVIEEAEAQEPLEAPPEAVRSEERETEVREESNSDACSRALGCCLRVAVGQTGLNRQQCAQLVQVGAQVCEMMLVHLRTLGQQAGVACD